jgi:fumarate hydratase class II
VIGVDSIVIATGCQGNFELNAASPSIVNNVQCSAWILMTRASSSANSASTEPSLTRLRSPITSGGP